MEFKSYYSKRPKKQGEINDGESLTEVKGFIPMKDRILSIVQAGQRLESARRESYDFPDGRDDNRAMDPLRAPGTDLSDVSEAIKGLNAKYQKLAIDKAQSTVETPKVVSDESQEKET